jgi:hypothetical protein
MGTSAGERLREYDTDISSAIYGFGGDDDIRGSHKGDWLEGGAGGFLLGSASKRKMCDNLSHRQGL